jgi:hypothetical protein
MGFPASRHSLAWVILFPNVECFQDSVAYKPTTRQLTFWVSEPQAPPRAITALSQSLRLPNKNVPVKQYVFPENARFGSGRERHLQKPSRRSRRCRCELDVCPRTKEAETALGMM